MWGTLEKNFSAEFSCARAHFNYFVRFFNQNRIVFNQNKRVSAVSDFFKNFPKLFDIGLVKAARRFVEANAHSIQMSGREGRKTQTSEFTARKGAADTARAEVAEPDFVHGVNAGVKHVCGAL